MRRTTTKLLVAVVVLAAMVTGVAAAALASPTATTEGASSVSNFKAMLHAKINPNGTETSYVFQYGITTAYGATSANHSAGSGTVPLKVVTAIGGLTPGTVYHYRVQAVNRDGTSVGADRTFTTTGPPPAGVVTGPAVNVTKTSATPTGTVYTNGAATTWAVQYGVTTAYGSQHFGQTVANSATPVPVPVKLSGFAPATLFHYRLVGYHGSKVVSYGADQVFFTEPVVRPKPRVSAHTKPSVAHHHPFKFTTSGSLRGASSIPSFARCTGNIGLRYYRGHKQLRFILLGLRQDCKFSVKTSFGQVPGSGATPVSIKITFRGNGYVARAHHTDHVTVR